MSDAENTAVSDKESSLTEWLRERTGAWVNPPPEHCLTQLYQPWVENAWPHPGLPAFTYKIPNNKKAGWPSGPDSVDEERQAQLYADMDEMRVQLVKETHNEFAEMLADKKSSNEHYDYLRRREAAMHNEAKALADEIDHKFSARHPETDKETNALEEALRLYRYAERLCEKQPGAQLSSLISGDTETRGWFLNRDLSPSAIAAGSYPDHNHFELMHPLGRPEELPCFRVEDLGFDCGIDYLPVTLSAEQFFVLAGYYFQDLEKDADYFGNTHALLCYRLQNLQLLLREHDLYGTTNLLSQEDAENRAKETKTAGSHGGRPLKVRGDRDPEDRRTVILELLNKRKNWHSGGPHRGKPKWGEIADQAVSEDSSLFKGNRRSYPETHRFAISGERIIQLVDQWEIDLEAIRKELDVPEPH